MAAECKLQSAAQCDAMNTCDGGLRELIESGDDVRQGGWLGLLAELGDIGPSAEAAAGPEENDRLFSAMEKVKREKERGLNRF